MSNKNQMSNVNKGFTLVELVVSMSVFVLVIGSVISIFISSISSQRRILLQGELLNQTSYALEYMSKALRTAKRDLAGDCLGQNNDGYNYLLTRYDSGISAYKGIKFINQLDGEVCAEFFLDNSNAQSPTLMEAKNDQAGINIISDKFKVNSARFIINGSKDISYSSEEDDVQPRLTIFLDISNKSQDNQPSIKIQTTVSQRDLNVK